MEKADDAPPRRWPLFLAGVLLFVLGPAIYFGQVYYRQLVTPWYVPVLATVGLACMATSVGQRRGIGRTVGLVLFALVCGFEWMFLLAIAKTPVYAGPAQPGHKAPEFTAAHADGRPFTRQNLEDGQRSALVFFRGRW
jgi:hypothetical protein